KYVSRRFGESNRASFGPPRSGAMTLRSISSRQPSARALATKSSGICEGRKRSARLRAADVPRASVARSQRRCGPRRRRDATLLRGGIGATGSHGPEPGVERGGDGFVELGEEVAVAIEGDRDGAVAHADLDGLRVGAVGDGQGNARVAQVVEPAPHAGGELRV